MTDDTDEFMNDTDLLDGFVPDEQRAARIALGNSDPNPDSAGQALKLAPQVGLPPAVVRQDPPGFAAQAQQQNNVSILKGDQKLSQLASDPTHYEAMSDDLDNIVAAKKAAAQPSLFGQFGAGFAEGAQSIEYGRAASKYQLGDVSQLPLLVQIESQKQGQTPQGLSYVMNQLGSFAGQLYDVTRVEGAQGTAAGAAIGGAGGAAVGGVAGAGIGAAPGEVIGAGAGAMTGLGYGIVSGFVRSSAGQAYRSLDLARGANGEQIPEALKQAASVTVGLVNGMIMSKAGSAVGENLAGLVTEGMTKAMTDPGLQTVFGKAAATVAKNGLTFGLLNAGMTAANNLIPQLAQAETGGFKTVINDPNERSKFVSDMAVAVRDGLVGGGMLSVLPIGANAFLDRLHVAQVTSEAAVRDNAMAAAEASKLKERAPDLLSQAIGNDRTIDVSADKIAEVRASDPSAFNYIPDVDSVVAQAQAHGGDVSIPAGDYYAKTPAETHELVKNDIRGENGLTVAEASDLHTKTQDVLARAEQGDSSAVATSIEPLRSEIDPMQPREPFEDPIKEKTASAVEVNLAAEKRLMWLDPIITPGAAGMNKVDFARYSKNLQDLQARTTKAVFAAADEEVRRRETPLWNDAIEKATDHARETLGSCADIMADNLLRDGTAPDGKLDPVWQPKLDRDASREVLGEASDSEGSVDPTAGINPKVWGKNGLHPDELADTLNFGSGKELLRALKNLQGDRDAAGQTPKDHFEGLVKAEALRLVEAKHGKFDDRVLEASIEAAMSTAQLEVLTDEMNQLAGDQKLTRQMVQAHADDLFSKMNAVDAGKMEKFQRLAGKFGQTAESSLLKRDSLSAFRAKQLQLVNVMLARASQELRRNGENFQKVINPFLRNNIHDAVPAEYNDQVQGILQNLGFAVKRAPSELASALEGKPLSAFVESKQLRSGADIPMPDFAGVKTDLAKLTVDQFRSLNEGLTALVHVGKAEKQIIVAGQKAKLSEVVGRFTDNLDAMPQKPKLDRIADRSRVKDVLHQVNLSLLKIERIGDWFDNYDSNGPFNQAVYRPLSEAKAAEVEMLKEYGGKLKALDQGPEWRKSLNNKAENTDLHDTNDLDLRDFTRHDMLEMMSHVGSDVNMSKLVDGMNHVFDEQHGPVGAAYHWTEASVMDFINRNATQQDWAYTRGVWKIFDELWPKVESLSREMSGIAPTRKEARTVQTAFGEIKGGYAPLRVDTLRSPLIGEGTRGIFDEGNYYRAKPPAGYTKDVTGAKYALSLEHGNTPDAIRETIHDLTHRQALTNADRFLSDRRVQTSINNAFGERTAKLFKPWLQDVAGSAGRVAANRGAEGIARALKYQRISWSMGQLVFRASTIAKHGMSAFFNSMDEVGAKNFAMEFKQIYGNPLDAGRKVQELIDMSPELKSRGENIDRDLRETELAGFGEESKLSKLAKVGRKPYAAIDMFSAAPTFSAAYKQALAKGMSDSEAVYAGDKAVRNAHGSAALVDLPSSARSANEFYKSSTVAYSFFNHVYNQIADTARITKSGVNDLTQENFTDAKAKLGKAFMRTVYYGVALAAVEEIISPTKQETGESWIWHETKSLARVPLSTVPFVRNLAHTFLSGRKRYGQLDFSTENSPTFENVRSLEETIYNSWRLAHGERPNPEMVKRAFGAVNTFVPVPGTGQAGTAAQFLWDLHTHHQTASTPGEVARGLAFGYSKPRVD